MTTCPNCGVSLVAESLDIRFVAGTGQVTYTGKSCYLHPMQIDILEHLLDAYPAAVTLDELCVALGTDKDKRVIARIGHMKHRFKQAGLAVDVECLCGSYALVMRVVAKAA